MTAEKEYIANRIIMQQNVDKIRDLAIELSKEGDIVAAFKLMELAHKSRKEGPLIKEKLNEYKNILLQDFNIAQKISKAVNSGHLAIIPAGFRCFTKQKIEDFTGIEQASLPFDYGFFSPHSIASILRNPTITTCTTNPTSYSLCRKIEKYINTDGERGIRFETMSKEKIDQEVITATPSNVNQYLDATLGYYTLDNEHNYISAHYNWHAIKPGLSKQQSDISYNIALLRQTLQRRIARMLKICEKAHRILFIVHETQNYKYIQIDKNEFKLDNIDPIKIAAIDLFGQKASAIHSNELLSLEL